MPLHDFRSTFMPYCLRPRHIGKEIWYEVRNREYLPIGFGDNKNHNKTENHMVIKLTKSMIQKLSFKPIDINDKKPCDIYLYNDGLIPTDSKSNMDSYLEKIRILMKAKTFLANS